MSIDNKLKRLFLSATLLLGGGGLRAQEPTRKPLLADTIRRELVVVNEREVELEEASPLWVEPIEPKLQTKIIPGRGYKITIPSPRLEVGALAIAPYDLSLLPKLPKSTKRGYLDLDLGLAFYGGLRAGYRLIQSEQDDLQLGAYWEGLYNRRNITQQSASTKETLYGAIANYRHRAETFNLGLSVDYSGGHYDYYGRTPWGNAQLLGESPSRNFHYADLSLGLDNSDHAAERWHYQALASIGLRKNELNDYAGRDIDANLLHLALDGAVSYQLFNETLLSLKAEFLLDKQGDNAPYGRSHYASLTPFVGLSGGARSYAWSLKLGAGLTRESIVDWGSGVYLWPYLDFSLSLSERYQLKLLSMGGDSANDYRALNQRAPYLDISQGYMPERTRLKSELSISGRVAPWFSLTIDAAYLRQDRHLSLVPQAVLATGGGSQQLLPPVIYTPTYGRLDQWSVGFSAHASYRQLCSIQLGAHYYSYQGVSYGLPRFVWSSMLKFNPLEPLEVNVVYDLREGVRYPALLGQGEQTLKALNTFSGQAVYRLSDDLSLRLRGALSLFNRKNEHLLYYPRETARLSLGIDWKF